MAGPQPTAATFNDSVTQAIRQYLRDLPDFRRRFEGDFVFEDDEIRFHVEMGLDRINSLVPVTSYAVNNIPFRSWLVRAVAISLCESRFHQLEGEEVVSNDPGGVSAVFQEFQSLGRRLGNAWGSLAQEIVRGKQAINLKSYLGNADGVPSVYAPCDWE